MMPYNLIFVFFKSQNNDKFLLAYVASSLICQTKDGTEEEVNVEKN